MGGDPIIASWLVYGCCGAVLVGLGLFGFMRPTTTLRRVLAFNIVGSGIFLLFGATGYRVPSTGADPVPQALIITGIVVALAATALAVALMLALARVSAGRDEDA
ncbi:NADH-quinone oxidoreductase subunit K [Pelagibacterium montanilacus]|uniref:NADH-quinone oxidoreductase subunit K n=1 Tax=Pelagibacterium montanilacus TaxID=2185280 RepID=UPI000F8D2CA4|nr:NADH-quinone oxidoreductase subunit K [Pelagibacterium montanilacus]